MTAFEPMFHVTPKMFRQLMTIDRARGFLEAVEHAPAWSADLRNNARVQDAVASVNIEGASMTYEAAMELALAPPDREIRKGEQEFLNYLRTFDLLDDLREARDYRLGLNDLLAVHRSVVEGVRGGARGAGELRRESVAVGDRVGDQTVVHHQPISWTDVEHELRALFDWVEAAKDKGTNKPGAKAEGDTWIHPVLVAGVLQHRLVWVHPFVDGNGRTARMMTTMLLYQRGYDFKLLFDLSSYYEKNRDAYYGALRTADRTGDYTRWLEYFLGGFAHQMYGIREKALANATRVAGQVPDGDGEAE